MTAKIIVVTGAAGFIGQYCLRLLINGGFEVHGFSKTKSGTDHAGVIWHQIDLLKQSAGDLLNKIRRPSHFLHLAWCTDPGVYWTSPENHRWLKVSTSLFKHFYSAGGVTGLCLRGAVQSTHGEVTALKVTH